MSLKKYGYHIANIGDIASILYRHINQAVVHVCGKTQPTVTSCHNFTSYVIHVPETNIPDALQGYSIYLMGKYGGCMCIYLHLMKSLASAMRPGTLKTCFTNFLSCHWHYITEKMWIRNCKCNSHCPHSELLYRPEFQVHICPKITDYTVTSQVTGIYVTEINMPMTLHICAKYFKC